MNSLLSPINLAVLIFTSFAISGCALSGKKAIQIPCPDTIGTVKGELAADAIPISESEVVMICGHREDLGQGKMMRMSEFEILRYNIVSDKYTKVWAAKELDVRYLKLHKKEKKIELIQSVFDSENKPIPILVEVFDCSGEKCELGLPRCLFKKDQKTYQALLPKKMNLKDWLQYQDSENRATALFLNAASGHKASANVILYERLSKIGQEGHFANVMRNYRTLLERTQKICANK